MAFTRYPSLGHMLSFGAGTIGESWEFPDAPPKESYCQADGLCPLPRWFYEYLCGLHPDPENPGFKHFFVPVFGLFANLLCMLFFLIGPSFVPGMSSKEPFFALGAVAVWGVYGGAYFIRGSKKKGKEILLSQTQSAQRAT